MSPIHERSPSSVCPHENVLLEWIDGVLRDSDAAASVANHVDECDTCRRALADVVRSRGSFPRGEATADLELDLGFCGGRYVPTRLLGTGGMSVVYEGWDEELGRPIAIKVLLDAPGDVHERLRREAAALAAFSHPNIVSVYDIGSADEHAFLVMELVRGQTLRQWLATRPKWPQILEVMLAAGRGIAAAHAAGLVHRDITPNNILVGDDGRARVSDFGLARAITDARSSERSADGARRVSRPAVQGHATPTAMVVGTPGYIAPEVERGETATAAADQYGFCATFYEALFGLLPTADAFAWPTRVPERVVQALLRGLRPRPEQRHPSMAALIDALQGSRHQGRAAMFAGATVVVVAMTAAVEDSTDRCSSTSDGTDGIWNAALVQQLEPKFDGADAAQRVERRIGAYVASWREAYAKTCREADGAITAEVRDAAMSCLRSRRSKLRALVQQIDSIDAPLELAMVLQAIDQLPPVSDCTTAGTLSSDVLPAEPRLADAVLEVRAELDAVHVAIAFQRFDAARERASAALEAAATLDFDPLLAEATYAVARLHFAEGEFERASAMMAEAAAVATAAGLDSLAARALLQRIEIVGWDQSDVAAARAMIPWVDVHILRAHRAPDLLAFRAETLGLLYTRDEDPERAHVYLRRAAELYEKLHGNDSLVHADAISKIGINRAIVQDRPAARLAFERAHRIYRSLVGPEHPLVGGMLSNLAKLDNMDGNPRAAIEHAQQALAILERTLPPEHPNLVATRSTLADAWTRDGQPQRALPLLRAAAIATAGARGDAHPTTVATWLDLAGTLALVGEADQAEDALAQALSHIDAPTIPAVVRGAAWSRAGFIALHVNRFERARVDCERAVVILGQLAYEPWLGDARQCVAQAHVGLGDLARGIALFRASLTPDYLELQTPVALAEARAELATLESRSAS